MGIYLDYNASSPIDERVLETMISVYKSGYGNADSRTHNYGESARKVVDTARSQVAQLLHVEKNEVFFTSGSTESNNIAIQGLKEYGIENGKRHIVTSTIEHKAVLETVRHLEKEGFDVDYVTPRNNGRISAEDVLKLVRDDTLLVSIMHANNETGVIQPIDEIGVELGNRGVLFHVDATQSCGKLVEEIKMLHYDMLSLSAHKFKGPQGIGALILRKKRYKFPPVKAIMYGGQQEHGIRPGTTPVALVAGLGKACEIAEAEYRENIEKLRDIKRGILKTLEESGLEYDINGTQDFCMPNTINISIWGVESEALMISSKQFCGISNGSACTSHDYSPSYVLQAMDIDEEKLSEAIRISWGSEQNKGLILSEFQKLLEVAKTLK